MLLALSITQTYLLQMAGFGALLWLLVAVAPLAVYRHRAHRTWFQRTVLAANIFLIVLALTAASGLTWFSDQLADIPRIELGGDVLAEQTEPGDPQNFLLVGIDQSEGLDPDDPVHIGRNRSSTLSDTVMVLRLVPEQNEAHLLSFPRDLWIPISGTGGRNRINTALGIGGPETLIRTIEENFGIPIHHYVQVNFAGFKQLVAILGGVPMYFPNSVRDPNTGLYVEVPEGGACVTLDPDQALAFVRSRQKYETLVDGIWRLDPSGDLGRIERQQLFMRLALQQAVDRGARNPTTMAQFIDVGKEHVVLDDTLTTGDMLDLGTQFAEFDPDSLRTYELPVVGGMAGEASVVYLIEEDAQDELNVFRGVSNAIPTIEGIRVSVRNGSGAAGQATEVSNALAGVGFTVASTLDAESFDYTNTIIRHAPGDLVTAVFLARFVDAEVVFEEVPTLGAASVELVTGHDFAGILAEPRPLEDFEDVMSLTTTTTTTTTTSPPAVTTTTLLGAVPEQPPDVKC